MNAAARRFQPSLVVGAALALLTAASLALRTGTLDAGYWIDEGIAVGIASHGLLEIPRTLGQDGSPPLYYLLLHVWMALFGTGEAATRSLSLLFALLAVPVSWWAGRALFGVRAGALAALGAAGCPFLTNYAQETRMYSLVALLSILACASFVLAFVQGQRRHMVWLGVWLVLLLYTHNWGVFLGAGMALAWLILWRRGGVSGRDGLVLAGVVTLLYAPWLPTVFSQAAHTGAPWSERPSLLALLGVPGGLFGYVALPLLTVAVVAALRRRRGFDDAVGVLLVAGVTAAALAWLSSQLDPAWATRYLAVLIGPLLLALAGVLARGGRWTALALVGVAGIWIVSAPPPVKSNVRTVSADVSPEIRPDDVVVSTQPEQVPNLDHYLPDGVTYLTPMGYVADPSVTNWYNGIERMRAGQASKRLIPLMGDLPPGRRILLVTPVSGPHPSQTAWAREIRIRTREWTRVMQSDPRLRAIGEVGGTTFPHRRSTVRAELFEVR